ncbi:hypothetical protein KL930_003298 [Ogataea haglerorum]|uniref:SANT domain-containing protein n=1 Tax=Ogataea haglerorum TaxID=1937702 RepID=A0ABQ7RI58_9ASCO|nr:hypothetical protein KL951_003100 [Ogataea haglerorum]KAG7706912.1 hypothetical protein KL914_002796 [Ogataea haglerorum]KAG7708781.1 hypothetical protein KL950_002301 [Ogataea haglerorum]KAG7716275.1 hypothetical protein KL913_003486 [Ogataea haglerorum]KAG7717024.1 hypothetical protein KL949_003620 [Ogataea haglerorum]
MSTVNKSGTRFTPKLTQRSRSRSVSTNKQQLPTPVLTHKTPQDAAESTTQEASAIDDQNDQNGEQNTDVFAKPRRTSTVALGNLRRPSVTGLKTPESSQRRLSSLGPGAAAGSLGLRSRQGSVSSVSERQRSSDERDTQPMKIGIPEMSSSLGRRRSSVQSSKGEAGVEFKKIAPRAGGGATDDSVDPLKQGKPQEVMLTKAEREKQVKFIIDPEKQVVTKVSIDEYQQMRNLPNSLVIDEIKALNKVRYSEDAELLENFVINDGKVTLEELCKPVIPFGKVSKNYELAIEGDRRRMAQRELRCKRRKLAREMRVPLNQLEGEEEEKLEKERQQKAKRILDSGDTESVRRNKRQPQLQLDENQKLILDPESTVIDRHSGPVDSAREVVDENPFQNLITSGSYSKKKYVDKWTAEETAEFYKALSTWGTDFGLIAQLFPYRTRRQVKAKFASEERRNPHFVELALLRKLPVDVAEYAAKTGKDFKTLEEYEAEIKALQTKHEKEMKEMKAMKERARLEDLNSNNELETTRMTSRSRREKLMAFRKDEEVVGFIDRK